MLSPQLASERLSKQKRELENRRDAIHADIARAKSNDPQERYSGNDEVLSALVQETEAQLLKIHHAEEKISNNTYGQCDSCGEVIDEKRLEAMPEVEFCSSCAQKQQAG